MYAVDFVEFPSDSADASGRCCEQAFGWKATAYGPEYTDVSNSGIGLGFQ